MAARLARGQRVFDGINITGRQATALTVTAITTVTSVLPEGVYHMWSESDVAILVGTTVGAVTSDTGYLLRAGNTFEVYIPENNKLGAVLTSAGTDSLKYICVD